ncbi:MAG: hypothetical protein U9N52_12695 [Campylobacterota bacterium]|nr:hypothetical protein [Campylobacterota bacterium]
MPDSESLLLIQSVVDSQKDLIALFYDDDIVLTNHAFNHFFGVASCEQYKTDFGLFVDNFVPHPSYFNKDSIEADETWMEAILKRSESDRIVSMMTPSFEPHAFSVGIDSRVAKYSMVTFSDITQSLIQRIMIENHANMDRESGAYAKEYFLHVAQSYKDAATFNEKMISLILIRADKKDGSDLAKDTQSLNTLVSHFRGSIRQDDMLVRWSDTTFLLIYLVDSESNAERMLVKLQEIINHDTIKDVACHLRLHMQQENEDINTLIRRIST